MYTPLDRALLFAALVAAAGFPPPLEFPELIDALRTWTPSARA